MINSRLRIAFFPDCYHEVDGVANTARQFEAFALRHELPLLIVHGGAEDEAQRIASVSRITYRRGPLGFALDKKHDFDLAFWRYLTPMENAVREFDPDLIHVTGPSDVGQLGVAISHRLRIPLAASWHTNVHEYAEQRAKSLLCFLPQDMKNRLGRTICRASLGATLRFYRIAQLLFAPNRELIELIERGTGKPCYPMYRGVDTSLFDPARRVRHDDGFVIGYVGRLTVEKNIRFLVELENALQESGLTNFRFLIVGQGAEEEWLRANMQHATLTGVLRGEALASAYANMDVFAFPSRTDTYGNVVLEALASGVPAVVTDSGGPQFIVQHSETGFIASDTTNFVTAIHNLAVDTGRLRAMRVSAREQAMTSSWDAVFESMYSTYERNLRSGATAGKKLRMRPHTALS
jgi:glycosyltransferase involved in cell wall biosynthesis